MSEQQKRGVGKPAFACAHCERAKRKCDGGRPCLRCQQLNKPCFDSPASAKRRQREGKVAPTGAGTGVGSKKKAPPPGKQKIKPEAPIFPETTSGEPLSSYVIYPEFDREDPSWMQISEGSRKPSRPPMEGQSEPQRGSSSGRYSGQHARPIYVDQSKWDYSKIQPLQPSEEVYISPCGEESRSVPESLLNRSKQDIMQEKKLQGMPKDVDFHNTGYHWKTEGGGGIFLPARGHKSSNQPNPQQPSAQPGAMKELIGAVDESGKRASWAHGDPAESNSGFSTGNTSQNVPGNGGSAYGFFQKTSSSSKSPLQSLEDSLSEIENNRASFGGYKTTGDSSSNSFFEHTTSKAGEYSPEAEMQFLSSLSADMSYEDVENHLTEDHSYVPCEHIFSGGKRGRRDTAEDQEEYDIYRRKRQMVGETTLRPMLEMEGVQVTSKTWLGFGVLLDPQFPSKSVELAEITRQHKHQVLNEIPSISKAINMDSLNYCATSLFMQVKMHAIPSKEWLNDNIISLPIDCLCCVARCLRKKYPHHCPEDGKTMLRHQSSLSGNFQEDKDELKKKESIEIITNCLTEIVCPLSLNETIKEILTQRVLLQLELPVVRIHFSKVAFLPTCIFMNRSASILFGVSDSGTEFSFVPGGGFGLQIHPGDLINHFCCRAEACAHGQASYQVQLRVLKDLSPFEHPDKVMNKRVVSAVCTGYIDYYRESHQARRITYVLSNVNDTEGTIAISHHQLLENYKFAVRRGILALWNNNQFRGILQTAQASSLAAAISLQIGGERSKEQKRDNVLPM